MYSSSQIANYFITKSFECRDLITPMKLQKLVYFAHGWYLAQTGKPLLDEQIEAWQFGPVVPSLYHSTKAYGNKVIETYISEYNSNFDYVVPTLPDDDLITRRFLESIWNVYSKHSAISLSNLTHIKGSPWSTVIESSGNVLRKNTDINDDLIKEYFIKIKQSSSNVG